MRDLLIEGEVRDSLDLLIAQELEPHVLTSYDESAAATAMSFWKNYTGGVFHDFTLESLDEPDMIIVHLGHVLDSSLKELKDISAQTMAKFGHEDGVTVDKGLFAITKPMKFLLMIAEVYMKYFVLMDKKININTYPIPVGETTTKKTEEENNEDNK